MMRWCSDVGVGGWFGMIALWVTVIGLAIWGVCRLFPAHAGAHAPAPAPDDLSDPHSPPSGPLRGA